MAIKLTWVADVILQVTKKRTTQKDIKNNWKQTKKMSESFRDYKERIKLNYFFGYYIKYLIYQHIDLISGQG